MFLSECREFPSAPWMYRVYCRSADKSLARPGRKQANVSVRMAWISFGFLPCKKKLFAARVSMLLKSHASLICFRACFLPGRVNNLSAPRCKYNNYLEKKTRFHVLLFCGTCEPVLVGVLLVYFRPRIWSSGSRKQQELVKGSGQDS